MLNHKQKQNLMKNWGDKADALDCYAEVRVYDLLSPWECYIYAMNPEDEDQIKCIIKGFFVSLEDGKMSDLYNSFNSDGESPVIDNEYRPKIASEVLKKLKELEFYDW